MRYQILFTLLLMGTLSLPIGAQNAIDKMINDFSVVGGATFTTAVERNPSTRKVEKVVKRLHVSGVTASNFVQRFNAEAKKHGTMVVSKLNGETTTTIIVNGKTDSRIYMLKHPTRRFINDATITLIVTPK